ncbi:M20/M25/M40 family metallo-hydrolase [Undibacterium sp. TS12]|uniref:M20/M25/M40 family metallo-hydrolase n=1 Tax=Undibacterium sp. TS12 TaxID=2908202 RepID=UPI001F4D1415|nr:M20/M25/M40 family metallo-hydrolase [Undibacterium sp. TS12]MCH8618246.1 M20/M25/M40 family metallo-hydrolase [Undibacterium sp. TS12]
MRLLHVLLGTAFITGSFTGPLAYSATTGEEKVDLDIITKLRDEAMNRSKAQEIFAVLTDEIGPRLTGSPALRKAGEWSRSKFSEWGMQNIHSESFAPFGRGWTLEKTTLRMITPAQVDLYAIPKAWTPGTDGLQRGKLVIARMTADEDLVKWKGKLAGTIVLLDEPLPIKPHMKADAHRYSHEELDELSKIDFEAAPNRRGDLQTYLKKLAFGKKLRAFLAEEKVLAALNVTRGEDGTIFVQEGGSYKKDEVTGPPNLVVASETYNRLYRLVEKKKPVELEIDVKARFNDEDPEAAVNVLAEIPGTDKKDEIVMLGAHLDSWHGGTGATDNAAGVAMVMEAVRLLKVTGFKPRRTIRIALWGGEEQGLLGSRAYVNKWIASRPEPTDPKELELPVFARKQTGPMSIKPMHGKISAYFNLDNGGGKIRGVYAENNATVKPIFDAWLAPFQDVGATTTTLRKTDSTDHVSFDRVGVPGFQFIQDDMDYFTRTHHSSMDVYDKVQKNDLMQASMILASFVAHTANRNDMLPRKPLPKDPTPEEKKEEEKKEAEATAK